jgi:8-oxo-dGTP pyrophosphatase MutT (NUDIX family)
MDIDINLENNSATKTKINLAPRKQSGVLPFKITEDSKIRVLLIRKTGSNKWGLPKGKVESHLTSKKSGKVEAWEEAGVKGKIIAPLGRFRYVKNKTKRLQTVDLYLLQVQKQSNNYLESERSRKWFSLKDAQKVLPREMFSFLQLAKIHIQKQRSKQDTFEV